MPQIVFIQQIEPWTVLHFSFKGEGACLRDFSRGPAVPPREIRGYSKAQVTAFLSQPGNRAEPAPEIPVSDTTYWHQLVLERNGWLSLPGNTGPGESLRVIDLFHEKIGDLVTRKSRDPLAAALQDWRRKLGSIVENRDGFNHWDTDNASGRFPINKGLHWTAEMLEFSRAGSQLRFSETGQSDLDFALVSMDLNLAISSKDNPIAAGRVSSVKPDGIGVRRDGTFCVFEVKGEDDCPELFRATIQALCGAVALCAKADMVLRLTQAGKDRRPAMPNPRFPGDTQSIGLYVMVDSRNFAIPEDPEFAEWIQLILGAYEPLREIAYFSVRPDSGDFPARAPVAKVYRKT